MEKKTKVDQLKDMMKAKQEVEERKKETAAPSPPPSPSSGEGEGGGKESQASVDEMASQIKSAEDEAKAHYDKLLRVMAEFENFKKRMEKERAEQIKFSNQGLICDIIPVLDDMDRVLEHVPDEAPSEVAAIADGIKVIKSHLLNALSKHGLAQVECAAGRHFDPSLHEAASHIESPNHEPDTVIAEHRRGYRLHGRLIRPAQVTVAKGPKKE